MKELNRKDFTNGFVAALELDDGKRIETTATCLPLATEMRGTGRTDNRVDYNQHDSVHWSEKFMVGISTQSGCPVKCKFCAVNKLTERQGWRNLTANEMIEQVLWAIDQTGHDPMDAKLFRILFTRMGEPAMNSEAVCEAIETLQTMFPNVRIQVSTIGFGSHSVKLVNQLSRFDNIELQFSIHSTDHEYRQWLQHRGVLSNEAISELIRQWHSVPREWKVTLNFALTTETPFDVVKLREQFNPDEVFIKVSPINENSESEDNGLKSLLPNNNTI
ncbi:radical SAM protein [Vibrio sp. SCSIO 43137]|uniref:radical SAM protein n=1 Tax=Vibrio sp. SCSIO 43137 TaxID=3021011 RepID=UPI002307571A|nr:radical SAM protein [Vibrio sp. SCSIO 43137]WCE28428.1 radical SAM protein [Vibrio sp. SCSIO 43137]